MKDSSNTDAKLEGEPTSDGWGSAADEWGMAHRSLLRGVDQQHVLQGLLKRIEVNIERMESGVEPLFAISEDEALLLRPRYRLVFGVGPDGEIRHCGNATVRLNELELLRFNNRLRMRAGFPPQDLDRIQSLSARELTSNT